MIPQFSMARASRSRLKSAPTAGRSSRAGMAVDETMVRSSPSCTWVAAKRLARSTSSLMSTVSSNGELNRLRAGVRP
ncbi:MAG: hypothetical protein AVDCRST_MAG61-3326 [uncultured Friedmanniella sp.]|uniref:Uncharacterized protein n=1 Tax=uncultured Friedmanniella sp. TaxID=335381 RepID=A0A6J4LQI5_9ACTN|nr:MAG: hypothetical protein AVDCRST_MAG61-3326 [uncultured Friedmanniella sp.]